MAQWATFAGVTGVVLVLLLVLSYLTQTAFSDGDDSTSSRGTDSASPSPSPSPAASASVPTESDRREPLASDSVVDSADDAESDVGADTGAERSDSSNSTDDRDAGPDSSGGSRRGVDPRSLSTGELLANVALSQGLFACVLLGAVVYTGIPLEALGVEFSAAYLREGLLWGTAAGIVLYAANEVGAAAATHFGFDHDEQLRELLAPDSARGWAILLAFVLPLIAGFEELLFRAALIGVISTGFGVSPWLLAVASSVAFAVGHGMQGSVGIVVTGLLGFVLAAVFVVTGSFLVVVVAHYLINALEFVVHEGLEFEWAAALESEGEAGRDGESEGHS